MEDNEIIWKWRKIQQAVIARCIWLQSITSLDVVGFTYKYALCLYAAITLYMFEIPWEEECGHSLHLRGLKGCGCRSKAVLKTSGLSRWVKAAFCNLWQSSIRTPPSPINPALSSDEKHLWLLICLRHLQASQLLTIRIPEEARRCDVIHVFCAAVRAPRCPTELFSLWYFPPFIQWC